MFALDTNVLLNIYRYATTTREDLFRVLRHLGSRVWVPYQVAREFYARRVDVIREQSAKYELLSRAVSGALSGLNDGAFRKSGFLRVAELEGMLRPAVEQAVKFINEQRIAHPDLIGDDPYLETLAGIVGTSLGEEPTVEQRQRESSDAQARIDGKQPPGYRDSQKPAPERYGDVFIWFELLRLGNTTKRPVVFVTDDDKEDWWQIVAGQKLGPRPELREEMRKHAGVEFYIYNPARIMELVGQELAVSVAPSSIDDARKIAEELQARNAAAHLKRSVEIDSPSVRRVSPRGEALFGLSSRAEEAVGEWLSRNHPHATVERNDRGRFDLLLIEGDRRTAVEVMLVRDVRTGRMITHRVRDIGYRAHYETSSGLLDDYLLVVVALDEENAYLVANSLASRHGPGPRPTVSVGVLDGSSTYTQVVQIAAVTPEPN